MNVGGLMALTALGQSVHLATAPILGRIYSPEAFGLYGLFYSFVVTAALFTTMNYDMAVPVAFDDGEAEDLARGAFQACLILCPAFGLAVMAFAHWNLFGFGQLPTWVGVPAAAVLLFQAVIQIQQSWRVRQQNIMPIGRAGVTLNFVRGGVQVACGAFAGPWWGLALGEVVGRLANTLHLARDGGWWPRVDRSLLRLPWATLRRYREFPVVLMPAQVMDTLVILVHAAALNFLFGPAGLGQYFLVRRTLDLPIAFAFRSLADVFYARLAEHARAAPDRVRPFFIRSFVVLLVVGAIGGTPLMLFGPQIFRIVFGEAWTQAGLLAALMTPAAVMNLAVAPASRIFALTRLPWLRFAFTVVSSIGTVIVLLIAWRYGKGLVWTTGWLSAIICASYLAYFLAGVVAAGALAAQVQDGRKR